MMMLRIVATLRRVLKAATSNAQVGSIAMVVGVTLSMGVLVSVAVVIVMV